MTSSECSVCSTTCIAAMQIVYRTLRGDLAQQRLCVACAKRLGEIEPTQSKSTHSTQPGDSPRVLAGTSTVSPRLVISAPPASMRERDEGDLSSALATFAEDA